MLTPAEAAAAIAAELVPLAAERCALSDAAGRVLREDLGRLRGAPISDVELNASIAVYNDNRAAVRELYAYRSAKPWQAPTSEVYLLLRAGMLLPPEEHTPLLREYIAATDAVVSTLRGMQPELPALQHVIGLELEPIGPRADEARTLLSTLP